MGSRRIPRAVQHTEQDREARDYRVQTRSNLRHVSSREAPAAGKAQRKAKGTSAQATGTRANHSISENGTEFVVSDCRSEMFVDRKFFASYLGLFSKLLSRTIQSHM